MDKYKLQSAKIKPGSPLADLAPISPLAPQLAVEAAFPFENKLFSISVIDYPLGDVLLNLANAADLNLILSKDVDRLEPVSVNFNNIPLKTALDTIISIHDYYYTIDKNILHVEGLQTRMFTVDYPLVYNKPESETGGDVLGGGGSGGGEASSAISSSGLKGEFTIEVEVEEEEHLDIWQKIEDTLKYAARGGEGLLSEQGKATVNRLSGTIVVTDRPKRLDLVEEFLDRISQALRRQVVIEAKIVEVSLNKGHDYGINWSMLKSTATKTVMAQLRDEQGALVLGENGRPQVVPTVFEGNKLLEFGSNLSAGVGGLSLGFLDETAPLSGQVVLDALATQGDVNVLSSPRLNVLNNQSALISVGRVIPYLDLAITTSEDEVNGETILRTESEPIIARTLEGVTLGITPQISEDGFTTLHIVPIIIEQAGSRVLSVLNEDFVVPVFSVRESDTMVTVADGQTIVIGGLIQEKTDDTIRKIPILGDIPLLKAAFSHQSRKTSKTELVILLTTTVVK
ncbi:MAG: hypothetical protein JRJ37_10480 [Deltaproteobacteria bacterium]|nr:hypothetical protein [Deltaproteobacteria bacterium]